jgi:hypothetical protein
VLSRLAGAVVTGPAAFLIAGLIDVTLLMLAYSRSRLARRRRPAG